ncbi:hypothetical protein SH661x_003788 [Planctomicrobium sp. SH661]|uniref:hypothetical protein n=1 Tax=Planctomicrobium sp. SH661 TaxID=3448124 RepID=UPI003F5C0A65
MNSLTRQQVNRFLVGILAIACVCAGPIIGVLDSWNNIWCGSFIRAGLLLGAFWVGMPTRGRAAAWANVSPWMTLGVIAAVILLIRRPQVLIPFGAVMGFLMFIVPLFTRAGKQNSPDRF